MYHLNSYLDSTFLKTAIETNASIQENTSLVLECIEEAIVEKFKLVMLRPEFVTLAKQHILEAKSQVLVGTVIDFPNGIKSVSEKIVEATIAIQNGADELDFVCNYQAFIEGERILLKDEILQCCQLAAENLKTIKFIIEVAVLNPTQIIQICTLIKNVVVANFKEDFYQRVFVKSSTGYFKTADNATNGATLESIIQMLENAWPLQIKASGGISDKKKAEQFIQLGVSRIGTSSAKNIVSDLKLGVITSY